MNRWPIARYLLGSHTVFLLIVLAGIYVFALLVVGAVSLFTDIRLSSVDVVGQALPWVAFGYGAGTSGLLTTVLVHGRTRREFLLQHPVFQVITTLLAAALITGAFAVEGLAYRAFGWTQKVQEQRAYDTAGDLATIFGVHWSMLLIWLMLGVFVGVAFYRWEAAGGLCLVPAGLLVLWTGGVNGFFSLPFARTGMPLVPVTLAAVVIAYGLLWYSARDVSVRTRVA
ncbi:hypothetical protein AMIS_41210 [Actinoplanes missouriensis 431]|uniref:Uncharacterized protein n=1 Tax=Actinoplanes missouriensis (strain ATCC 14538 / DSM 43046 / CBS 188.64 / JCM 3121 / NBRC 102363 / NCIMB 12654 / NRRL B-3342 / UNCC 431) TaxID=512565 RepID=I0H8K4_ACTM4|nr:hypothetical protein [Actinoplanes missouriensis]BAL89341.1 hypothetical protein AMIS_41210 [Actinoplanes missouriensis 431]